MLGFWSMVMGTLLLASCDQQQPSEQRMVMEAWIEAGKEPVVMLHYAYPLAGITKKDTMQLEDVLADQLETWARVAISDGEQEVVLTGQLNTHYMPPFIYTSTHMVGEPGRTYTITATRREHKVSATTTIPMRKARVDSIVVRNIEDSTQSVVAYMSMPENVSDPYYNLFIHREGEPQLIGCPIGLVNHELARSGHVSMPVYINNLGVIGGMNHFLNTDTAVYVLQAAALDEMSYRIWEGISAQSVNQGMFFMSVYRNMPSNVSSGVGYWCGYNSDEYRFTVQRDSTFVY